MTSTKTSEVKVWEQLKDIMECCVCRETCKDPKVLPCIHTFCRTCLEEKGCKTGKNPGDQMPCPMCRKEFTIPEEGYAALQKNSFMEKLIERSKITSSSGGSDLCEACLEGEKESASASEVPLADKYCTDCQKKLCQECSRHHRKNHLTNNHRVVAAADFKCKEQITVLSNCMKHKREIDLYCSDCKKLLCKQCFREWHQNHRLQDVRNVIEGFINEIKGILSGLEVCISKDLEKKEILNSEVEEYCKHLESLKLEVRAQTGARIKLVIEHAKLIMQGIDQLKVQKRKEVKAEIEESDGGMTCLESFKVHCAEVMTKGSASNIFCSIDELRACFQDIKKVHESGIKVKTYFRKKSVQMSNLEEFVKTADFNLIGTIQECQTETEGEGKTKTTSDNITPDGHVKMENNSRMAVSGNSGIIAAINRLRQELENERRRNCGLEMEKKALEERINELKLELGIKRLRKSTSGMPMAEAAQQPLRKQVPSPRISIDYKRSPTLVKTLQSGDGSFNGGGIIFGLTVLDDELFVGCFIAGAGRSVVEVYDIKTFIFKRRWQVKHLSQSSTDVVCISSMESCTRHKCLYACGSIMGGFAGYVSVIQRLDLNGSNAKEWKIYGGIRVSDLSVTGEGNIIVITGSNSLVEYSRDGVLVHEMKLPGSLGIEYPLHALKLASGNFVVSHSFGKGRFHRVLILSESGQITKSFGEMPVSDVHLPQVYDPKVLKEPVYLTVDGSGNILVADLANDRIVVLNSNLEFQSSINPNPPLQAPSCMCIDADRRRLFVCEGLTQISVYDFCLRVK